MCISSPWQHFVKGVTCLVRHVKLGNKLKMSGNHWSIDETDLEMTVHPRSVDGQCLVEG